MASIYENHERAEQTSALARSEFDPEYAYRCYEENLRFLAEEYFRARLINEQNFPFEEIGKRAVILVPNHSGMGLSWDNIMLDFLVYDLLKKRYGSGARAIQEKVRRMVDPLLISHPTVTPFAITGWWSRIGCVPASFANLERAVKEKRLICISPEGVGGIAKGFGRRYQLQRYSSSFIALARKYGAIVVPVSVVNAEYIRPYNYSSAMINRFARKLGFPFVPFGLGALQFTFPATYLTAMPAKLTYVLQEPIEYEASHEVPDQSVLRIEAEQFRTEQQHRLLHAVSQYHAPFDLAELWQRFKSSPAKRMFLPFFWHEMFLRAARAPRYFAVFYKIPFGYPLIWLAKKVFWKNGMPRKTNAQISSTSIL